MPVERWNLYWRKMHWIMEAATLIFSTDTVISSKPSRSILENFCRGVRNDASEESLGVVSLLRGFNGLLDRKALGTVRIFDGGLVRLRGGTSGALPEPKDAESRGLPLLSERCCTLPRAILLEDVVDSEVPPSRLEAFACRERRFRRLVSCTE